MVAKIIVNPSSANSSCSVLFAVDNIVISTLGPTLSISKPFDNLAWIDGTCFQGNDLVELEGSFGPQSLAFGPTTYTSPTFSNPAFQWQQSIDDGYTWTDIPGQTNQNLSYHFSIADTFFVRLSAAEAGNISNAACRIVSNVIKIQVDGIPTQYSVKSNSPVCQDGDLEFELSGGASYLINGPNGYFDNTPFPHIFRPDLEDTGWYYVQVRSFGGCSVTDSTYVQITGPDVNITNNTIICYGQQVQLQSGGGVKYSWTPADGLSGSSIENPVATPSVTTTYQVKVTDRVGCSAYDTVKIALRNGPLKAIVEGPRFACPSDIVTLIDSSQGDIVSWNWDFGNGQSYRFQHPPPRSFLTNNNRLTDYPVKLTVTDTSGCINTVQKIVTAVPNCYLDIPSAFSPNNDGLNDYLYPLNAYKASNIRFRVFSRKGQLIFETRELFGKWDGTFKGEPQSPGTYVWVFEYTDLANQKILRKGTAVLIR